MDIKRELDKKIEKKKQEIFSLEQQIGRECAYLQARRDAEDTRKMLPKDLHSQPEFTLRPGSELAKVQEVLKKENAPLHIDELLKRLGKPLEKKQKISLSGSLASYARDGRIFTRPAANTFGLLEFENTLDLMTGEPPEDFGVAK